MDNSVEACEIVDVIAGGTVATTELFEELDVNLVVFVVASALDEVEAFIVVALEDRTVLTSGDLGVLEEVGGHRSLDRGTGDHRVHPAVIAEQAEVLVGVVDLEAGLGDALELDVAAAGVEGGQGDGACVVAGGEIAAGRGQVHGPDDRPMGLVEREPDGVVGHGVDSFRGSGG